MSVELFALANFSAVKEKQSLLLDLFISKADVDDQAPPKPNDRGVLTMRSVYA